MAPKKLAKPERVFLVSRRFFFFFPGWRWTTVISLDYPIVSSPPGLRVRGLGWLRVGGPQRLGRVWRGRITNQWSSWEEFCGICSMSLDMAFPFRSGRKGHTIGLGSCSIAIYPLPKMVS